MQVKKVIVKDVNVAVGLWRKYPQFFFSKTIETQKGPCLVLCCKRPIRVPDRLSGVVFEYIITKGFYVVIEREGE